MSAPLAPRLGLLFVLLAALALLAAFAVPLQGDLGAVPGAAEPLEGRGERCLRLRYEPDVAGRWQAKFVRLRPERAFSWAPDELRYQAERDMGTRWQEKGIWRPAGADSFDLAWHHTPVLRLPVRPGRGDTLVGRGGWAGRRPLASMLTDRGFTVRAVDVPCPGAGFGSAGRLTTR